MQLTKVVVIAAAFLLTSCGEEGHTPEISGVNVDLHIERLDRELFVIQPDLMASSILPMQHRYGEFFQVYVEQILQAAPLGHPQLPLALISFTQNPDWKEAQQKVETVLGDLDAEKQLLEKAFARLSVIFPSTTVPQVITYNSGFNYGVMPMDSVLGIGLEWFIGPESKVIQRLAPETFPQFMRDRMKPEMLVPSAMKGWCLARYGKDLRGEDLLAHLIDAGKVIVLLETILPEILEHDIMAFKPEQLQWCQENEFNIWKAIIDEELLYSKKDEDIGRFMNDAPFTNGFPRESPGHIGEWVGAQMVRAYLKDHDDMTLAQLFEVNDPQRILKSYRPR